MRDLIKAYRNSFIAALIFACYVLGLFWNSLDVQRQLEDTVLAEQRLELEKDATAMAYVLSERASDVAALARSREVANLFGNIDLGMSYEYGLGLNVLAIEESFEGLVGQTRLGGMPIYQAFVLFDESGPALVASGVPAAPAELARLLPDVRTDVSVQMLVDRERVVLAAPVWIKGRYRGHLLAVADIAPVRAQFVSGHAVGTLAVADAGGTLLWSDGAGAQGLTRVLALLGRLPEAGVTMIDTLPPEGQDHAIALIRVPVGESPLALVALLTESQLDRRPVPLIMRMGVLGVPLAALLVVFLDIRAHRRAELAREAERVAADRAARARSEFLARMSHEIRTPLNAMLGLAQAGVRDSRGRQSAHVFERIIDSGRHLLGVVNDVLDFSRIEAGKMKLERIAMSPGEVVDRALALTATHAYEKGLRVEVIESELPARCDGDPQRLTQVLVNLLGNAIKFTEQGGITLEARASAGRLSFAVSDTGIGMRPEEVSRLFSPFEQADGSTTRRFGGTGLGLSISEGLVSFMGGVILVRSEMARGSRFEVRIPLLEPQPAGPVAPGMRVCFHGLATDEAEALVQGLAARGVAAQPCDPQAPVVEACLLVLDAAALQSAGEDALPRAALERSGMRIALLGEPGVLDALPLPDAVAHRIALLERPLRIRHVLSVLEGGRVAGHAPGAPAEARLPGIQVLVVDDNQLNQLVLGNLLQQEGATVDCASGGQAALDLLEAAPETRYQMVLSDIEMPEMDGYALARELARRHPWLPVIGLTAHAGAEYRERCLAAGMREHVTKPVDIEMLVAAILREVAVPLGAEVSPDPAAWPAADAGHTLAVAGGLIDWPELERRFGNKAAFVTRLAGTALESYRTAAAKLRDPAVQQDAGQVAFIAHGIKSSAGTLKAERLYQLAIRTDAAACQRLPGLAPLADELATALDEVMVVLDARVSSGA